MELCIRCGAKNDEVKLFDAIYNARIEKICERCSIIENVPLIKKPATEQLKEAESNLGVYERMQKIQGIKKKKKENIFFREDKLNELNSHPELELPEQKKLNLIEHFHWEIMKLRRRKGLTQQKLAENLGESEIAIQMIEKSKLPEHTEILIKKLEQFFQVNLRKNIEIKKSEKTPILLDEKGNELKIIPEEKPYIPEIIEEHQEKAPIISDKTKQKLKEIECKIKEFEDEKIKMICGFDNTEIDIKETFLKFKEPQKDLDLKKIDPKNITINQLRNIHRKKIEVTKIEQIQEQRKIEERQRILEALRERDRLKHEEIRKRKLLEKENQEKEKFKLIQEKKIETEMKNKKESEDINKFLGGTELIKNKNSWNEHFI